MKFRHTAYDILIDKGSGEGLVLGNIDLVFCFKPLAHLSRKVSIMMHRHYQRTS